MTTPVPSNEELERQMESALANYNSGLDMGNDPVGSGRNLGLQKLSKLDAALLPPVPKSLGEEGYFWVGWGLATIFAFWYLFF